MQPEAHPRMNELTQQNRAVVVHARGDLRVEERPEPDPAPDEAVVAVVYGGICGSDLHYWQHGAAGESILRAPMILGHEVVGEVVRAPADGSGPDAGARVAVHPATRGTYLGSAARLPHCDGAFAQRIALPSRMLRALPDAVGWREAALVEPASVAWHAVSRAGVVRDRRALVVGCGPIGALVVAVLRTRGATDVVATDLHPDPLARAGRLGATETIAATDRDALDAVDADVVIEASGSAAGLATAIRAATRGGRVVMLGLLPPGEQPVAVSLAIARELELVGSFRFEDEIEDVIAALHRGDLEVALVITHEFGLDDTPAAFETARDAARSSKVLLRFGAGDDAV